MYLITNKLCKYNAKIPIGTGILSGFAQDQSFSGVVFRRIEAPPGLEDPVGCCGIEVNIDDLAHAAATLANYGWCPSTGKKVFRHDTTIRDTLSLMYSSGMYGHSGEFAFKVGMPAKSGVAGGIMVVILGWMGIAVYKTERNPLIFSR